ncbi:MAG: HlyD family secretion protein [Lewinella sp.]
MPAPFLPHRKPNQTLEGLYARHYRRGYPIYLTILATLLLFLTALPFVSVDIGSEGRAILQTTQRPTSILSPVEGRVLFANLRDNQEVAAGDTLLLLDATALKAETKHLRDEIRVHQEAIADLRQLMAVLPAKAFPPLITSLYQRDYQDFRHQWDQADLKVTHTRKQLERQETLFASGTIAKMDIEGFRFNHEISVNEQRQLMERRHHLWTQELARNERALRSLRLENNSLHQRSRHLVITAPTAGHLMETSGLVPGSFVGPAQKIAKISPTGPLEVAIHVSPQDIGLIREGTPVTMRMDAFTHTRWGLAHARVQEIGQDVIADPRGRPAFLVKCTLLDQQLILPSGHRGKLTKGMTATAHFTLAHRTLAQLLRDRLEDWLPTPTISKE